MSQHVICLIASPLVHVTWGIVLAFNAMPMMVSGKPYVSISADHSEPGSRLKYAPNPYLKSQERTKSSLSSYFIILNNAKHNCAIPTYDKRVPPTPSPITPNETCMKWDSIRRQKLVAAATIQHLLSLLLLLLPQELKNAPPVAHLGEGELLVGDDGLPGRGPGRRRRGRRGRRGRLGRPDRRDGGSAPRPAGRRRHGSNSDMARPANAARARRARRRRERRERPDRALHRHRSRSPAATSVAAAHAPPPQPREIGGGDFGGNGTGDGGGGWGFGAWKEERATGSPPQTSGGEKSIWERPLELLLLFFF